MRLGLLQDPAAIDRQIKREAQEAEEKRLRAQHRKAQDVRTEEQMRADEEARDREKRFAEGKVKNDEKRKERRLIRPLSEAKAIDSGANFISEAFVFGVAVGLLLFENWRSRRKENNRRDMVKERLDKLEDEIERSDMEKALLLEELGDMRSRLQGLPLPAPPAPTTLAKKPVKKDAIETSKSDLDSRIRSDNDTRTTTSKDMPALTSSKQDTKEAARDERAKAHTNS